MIRENRERRPVSAKRGGHRKTRSNFVYQNGNGQQKKFIPPAKPGVLRIIALGGFAEVGRNMMFFEYGGDILIIDMGLQFPDENMHGVDYIIPNISYLENKKDRIRGVIITHGHYDHIGAVPQLMSKLGNPTIYTTRLTAAIIQKRQEDYPYSPKLDIEYINEKTETKLGVFTIRYFPVTHNIPEGVGLEIETPVGIIAHPGEFKFFYDRKLEPLGLEPFRQLGKKNVRLLMLDSTKSEEPGRSVPEWQVEENIEELLKKAGGRVIVSTFASLLDRLTQIVHIADKLGRKVAVTGRSMQTNLAIAQELGLIKLKRKTIIPIKEIDDHPDDKIVIITTGAQGEENAGLTRMASGSHREVRIKPTDTVIFSSSIVPGNEMYVQTLRDNLARQGAIVYHYKIFGIHSGGHATRIELKETMEIVKPQCFLPIHGFFYMRAVNAKLAEEAGINPKNVVVPDNGQILELTKDSIKLLDEKVPTNYVMVDGLGVGDVKEVVLRDRQMLAADGIFVIIAVVDAQSGKVRGSPDIISRGFVYLRESKDLLHQTRLITKKIVENAAQNMHPINWAWVKDNLRDDVGKFLFQKTHRRPMVLPVVIEV
ncbi:MAG: ribonuclease J [Candidatus Niyogibacteria bacterium]|nr:MAG: ribonuclease J [Candidatus Niyogibacteria bacterium]